MRGFTKIFGLAVLAANLLLPVFAAPASESDSLALGESLGEIAEGALNFLDAAIETGKKKKEPKAPKPSSPSTPPPRQPPPATRPTPPRQPSPPKQPPPPKPQAKNAGDPVVNGMKQSAHDFIAFLHDNAAQVNAKPICFYTGTNTIGGKAVSSWTALKAFSADRNCNYMQTLLDMLPGARQNALRWEDAEWTPASEAVAAVALNTPVYALLGQTVSDTSVWVRAERPKLQERLRDGKIQNVGLYTWVKQGKDSYVFTPAGDLPH